MTECIFIPTEERHQCKTSNSNNNNKCLMYTGWPKKVSHYQMIKKSHYIVLKDVNEIRFIR